MSTKVKHTPGPWIVVCEAKGEYPIKSNAQYTLVDAHKARERSRGVAKRMEKSLVRAALAAITPITKGLNGYERGELIRFLVEKTTERKKRHG